MSSIWVRTKSYLWGNNGEQPEVTWPDVTSPEVTWPEETMSGTGSMLCVCATGSFAIPLVGTFHRKWPEMIVIMDTEGVEGYAHANRKLRNIPYWIFSPEVGYRKWRHFPRAFFLVVVQIVGWGCSIRRPHLTLSLVICPFYFHKYI